MWTVCPTYNRTIIHNRSSYKSQNWNDQHGNIVAANPQNHYVHPIILDIRGNKNLVSFQQLRLWYRGNHSSRLLYNTDIASSSCFKFLE